MKYRNPYTVTATDMRKGEKQTMKFQKPHNKLTMFSRGNSN